MGIVGFLAFLLIPAIFGGVGAGVYFWILKPPMEAKKILEKGIETTATVIGIDSNGTVTTRSGNTTTSRRYYNLRLSFINSGGEEIEYKTRSIYPESFIHNHKIEQGGTVQVIYAGAKAVVKSLVPEKADTALWTFPIVFGAIAAIPLIFLVFWYVRSANEYLIKKSGIPATGAYVETCGNGTRYNSITYTFKNDNGDTIEVKTRFVYTDSDAKKIAEMGFFPIRYKGEKAVIAIDKNNNKSRKPTP